MPGPVPSVTALGASTAAGVVWRRVGQPVAGSPAGADRTLVTVVVKGTFALVADRPMVPIDPEPIAPGEERGDAGLRTAGDLAPYQPRADIMLIGHVDPPAESRASPPFVVGLGLNRAGAWSMSKRVSLADRRIGDLGPRSRPALSRFTGPDGLLTLPDPFDWSLFQAAPTDQQVDHLQGQEWIALSGVVSAHPVLMTRLPAAVAAAKLHGEAPNLRAGRPIPLLADTLLIDADRRTCVIVWRGQFAVSGVDALPHLRIVAGVELPDRPIGWKDPLQVNPSRPPAPLPPPPAPLPPRPAARLSSTAPVGPESRFKPATPFEAHVAPPPADGDPWLDSTAPLTAKQVAELLAKPALPFEAQRPAPAPMPSSDSTSIIDPAALYAAPATPFGAPAPPAPLAPPVAPPPMMSPMAAPPLMVALPAPQPDVPLAEEAEPSPGDEFLDAVGKDKSPRLSPTERLAARRRKPKNG